MNKLIFTCSAILLAALATLSSCKKENKDTDTDTSAAQDHAIAQSFFTDLENLVDEATRNQNGLNKTLETDTTIITSCATFTLDTNASPKKLTIDFGTNGCTGRDGRLRTGKLEVTYTGRYRRQGTIITITPDNYSVNGYAVEGTKTVTNLGNNSNGQPHFSVVVTNGKISGNGKQITHEANRTRTWISGSNTANIWDDVYEITGTGSGTNTAGVSYITDITRPLRVEIRCRWIVSGTVDIVPSGKLKRTVDFGNGTCDNKGTVSIANRTYDFEMK